VSAAGILEADISPIQTEEWPTPAARPKYSVLSNEKLIAAGIPVETVKKLQEGHPNLLDHLIDGRVQLIFNTPRGKGARTDEGRIRAASVLYGVPCITTLPAAVITTLSTPAAIVRPSAFAPLAEPSRLRVDAVVTPPAEVIEREASGVKPPTAFDIAIILMIMICIIMIIMLIIIMFIRSMIFFCIILIMMLIMSSSS
jgi:hypothetical protein